VSVLDEIKVIDADTHVVEPYDLWTSRMSVDKWGDRVPHVRWDEAYQRDVWVTGDEIIGAGGGGSTEGRKESAHKAAPKMDNVDPSTWRQEDRLALMDRYGIHAQILYPNVAGFGGGQLAKVGDGDVDFAVELVRAYNDYLADYSSVAPDRFIPIMAVPFWDIDRSIAEMKRAAELGHKGLLFSQAPEFFGEPVLSDPHWDRLWAAAQDMGLTVNFHIGGGDMEGINLLHPSAGAAANFAAFPVTFWITNGRTIAQLIGGGICHRFPDLNFVSVESGVGWLPFIMSGLDWMWKECRVTLEHPEYDLLPSEYFRRQIYGCFWFEHGSMLETAIELVGADNILYETDFPHPCSMTPGPTSCALPPNEFIKQNLGSLPDDVLRKILSGNAARIYHLG
jgi:predicted TIM-barrel fold metal-dependent hydrolase